MCDANLSPCALQKSYIAKLAENAESDENLHSWGAKDFENAMESDSQRVFIISDFAFVAFSKVLNEAEILMIWVMPSKRAKGQGEKLLCHAIGALLNEGVEDFFLEVACDNYAAIKLYEKIGFESFSRRKNYYKRDYGVAIDAIMMRRLGALNLAK